MIDLIQLQDDLYGILMSAPQLAPVNIVQERAFLVKSNLEKDVIWQTARNGRTGNGLLIEIPKILCDSDGVSGPPQQVELSFVSFQNGDAAFIPPTTIPGQATPVIGGGLFAEQVEQFLVDILHLLNIGGVGSLRVAGQFSSPARDYPGVNARRTRILMTPRQTAQTARVALPIISLSNGTCTIICGTVGAVVYYTLDGSFPSNPSVALTPSSNTAINANSKPYTAPFSVAGGQLIRAAGYLAGYNLSLVVKYQN